ALPISCPLPGWARISPLLLSRSSIASTSTSMTSTAKMRITKVLPRYQVSVRDGKKSNSTGHRPFRQPPRPGAIAPAQDRAQSLADLGIGRLERADGLPAGHESHAIVHPADQHGERHERPPQR